MRRLMSGTWVCVPVNTILPEFVLSVLEATPRVTETAANRGRSLSVRTVVKLPFVVYDLAQIYTLGDRNEPGANANQSLT